MGRLGRLGGLGRFRKAAAVAALSAALAGGMVTAGAAPASASGFNWDDQFGPTGSGCYFWTTWSANMVTPHGYQQTGDAPSNWCMLSVSHIGYNADGTIGYSNTRGPGTTTGPGSEMDGPSWYYGPWGNGGYMCVIIGVRDYRLDVGSRGPSVVYCP
ncbi:hypothetical protein BX285_6753 [Streptomyces sp. 1114.5]|nr:hypothetical protein BX285_6753 [Streptomyces sp. 1114.5]